MQLHINSFYILDLLRNVFSKFNLKSFGERLTFYVVYLCTYWPSDRHLIDLEFSRFFPSDFLSDYITADNRVNVFIYWDTGFSNAPDVVKACSRSLQKVLSPENYRIIFLDSSNIEFYLPLSPQIRHLYDRSFLHKSHYSDLLRSLLLFYHGGIWVDSTMFFVGTIPSEISNSSLFSFRTVSVWKPYSNQFIVAKAYDPAISQLFKFVVVYLIRFVDRVPIPLTYSFYHYLFSIALSRVDISVSPFYSGLNTHLLQHNAIGSDISPKQLYSLFSRSFVHKLTYKKPLVSSNNIDILSSLLNFIL